MVDYTQELLDTRKYTTPAMIATISAGQDRPALSLMLIMLEILRAEQPEYASLYLSQTQFNADEITSTNTDLGNLLCSLGADKFIAHMYGASVLHSKRIGGPMLWQPINRLLNNTEDSLKLLESFRRQINQWEQLTPDEKLLTKQQLLIRAALTEVTSDLIIHFTQTTNA